ncbi:MAG: MalT-like region [Pseudomonadota bacterium]|jgi:tetratricopeptide (TPR) repeat protein
MTPIHSRRDRRLAGGPKPLSKNLLALTLAALLAMNLLAKPTRGQSPEEEAQILWNRAQDQLRQDKIPEAAHTLRQLVNRTPTHSRTIEAQHLLGEVEMELGNASAALEILKIAEAQTHGHGSTAQEIQRLRARAYLALSKPTEALLLSEKLLKHAEQGQISWMIDAQILKTRALFQLKQERRAQDSLAAARKLSSESSASPALAELWLQVLALRATEARCLALPSSRHLEEDQAIHQVQRLAECFKEAETMLLKVQSLRVPPKYEASSLVSRVATTAVLQTPEKNREAQEARQDAQASLRRIQNHLVKTCETPPIPPGKRTKSELKQYLRELKAALEPQCQPLRSKVTHP